MSRSIPIYSSPQGSRDQLHASYLAHENVLTWSNLSCFSEDSWEWDNYDGRIDGYEWLDALAVRYENNEFTNGAYLSPGCSALAFTGFLLSYMSPEDRPHHFLDSFSIVENGEYSRRCDRKIEPSPCQRAILSELASRPDHIVSLSPREFEVTVAYALAEIGFEQVELRRYCKDDGADVIALLADGPSQELVIIEVKHSSRGITLAVMDRLNGVRNRMHADRGLCV